jgi:predicted permease
MRRARRALEGLDDELRDHIEREIQENLARGMTPDEARRRAMVRFGNLSRAKDDTIAVWRWRRLEQVRQDARYALRTLRRRPAYTLLSVITLALGVAGIASVYGVARGMLFDPLPFAHEAHVGVFWKKTDWTHAEYLHIRGRVPGFDAVALYRRRDVMIRDVDGPPRLVPAVSASAELLDVLGARPVLGSGFRPGDDVPNAEPVVILGHAMWQELGGAPAIIGTRLTLDGAPRTVIGVMPRGFWFPDPSVRLWISEPLTTESRSWNSTLIGRVSADHDVESMGGPVARLAAMLDARFDYPAQWDKTKDAHITPVRDDLVGSMRPAILATIGAMALILLIGCANVAALVLGQLDARSAELAVRSALGANRGRLLLQLVFEVFSLAAWAGAFGAVLAWLGFTVITHTLPLGAWTEAMAPDWRIFVSAMAIALVAASMVLLVPIVSLSRGDLRGPLQRARTMGIGRRGGRLENGLVIAQVALAVMVAAGAALLARSVANLYAIEPGVRIDGVAVVDVVFGSGTNRTRLEQSIDAMTTALLAVPGVQSVGASQNLPLRGGGYNLPVRIDAHPDRTTLTTEYRVVTPGYLETIGMTVRRGRTISDVDRRGSERVVVVNEEFVRRFLGGSDPLGHLVEDDAGSARVIGVVADAVERGLTDAAHPVRYVAFAQMPWLDHMQSLVVRLRPGADASSVLESSRRAIARVAPDVAVQHTTTMRRLFDVAVGPTRQVVVLLSLLTATALVLGAVGVYGVITHFALRRRRDWAIRVALGLPASRVISRVVGHGALLVSAGIVVGLAGATALTRALTTFLYGVGQFDLTAFAVAAATLLGVGIVAALFPAWRAGMADPLIALREQ